MNRDYADFSDCTDFFSCESRKLGEIGGSEAGLKGLLPEASNMKVFISYAGEDREIAEKIPTNVSEELFYAARSNSIPENKAIGISV